MKILLVLDVPDGDIERFNEVYSLARKANDYYMTHPVSIALDLDPESRLGKFRELVSVHKCEGFKALTVKDFPKTSAEALWLQSEHPNMVMGLTLGSGNGTCPVLLAYRTHADITVIEIPTEKRPPCNKIRSFLEESVPSMV